MKKEKNVLGHNIAAARKRQGLAQKELAEKIGVSPQRLNNWEKGLHHPDADHLAALALELRVSADCLLGIGPLPQTEEEARLLTLWRRLSEPSGKAVIRTASDLARLEAWASGSTGGKKC